MLDRQQIERMGLEEALRRMLERNAGWSGLPEPEVTGDFGDLKVFCPDGRPVEMEEWPLVRSIRSGEEVREVIFVRDTSPTKHR